MSRIPSSRLAGFVLASILFIAPASVEAQIGGRLRQQVQNRVENAVSRALDRVECAITDHACVEKAEREGKPVKVVDGEGREVPGGASAAQRPGQGAWANYDFVPGERVLFAEDFARDRVGNFPQRLEFIHGNMEVVDWQGRRWLQATSKSAFAIPLPETLPSRFTMEFDVTLPSNGLVVYFAPRSNASDRFLFNGDWPHPFVVLTGREAGVRVTPHNGGSVAEPARVLGVREPHGELVRLRIHGDGRYTKVYLNEQRVANIPNLELPRDAKVFIETTGSPLDERASPELTPTLISGITVNAGGRTLYDALNETGRVATQGILFDVGSDRLRPESTPTLREIADMLKQNGGLRITIEGHTDNTGNADANQKLSEQRAAAVRQFLVDQHGIDAARLQSQGLGQSKPAAPNDTPEGRQMNRRVELVRL
jgi:OmpA-OmpF porin, OOP family